MTTIQEFFKYGLDRDIPALLDPPEGPQLNLGPGRRKVIPNTIGIGMETGWCAPETMRWPDTGHVIRHESVAAIHAYQFMEHLNGEDAVVTLKECERVLMPGGVMFITSPCAPAAMAYQALDHKSFWNEEVWHWLFGNEYYDDHEVDWKLSVWACFLMGVVQRNLNVFTQLVKEG